eukprot:60481-Alexandrium_andersonii.AAC.1
MLGPFCCPSVRFLAPVTCIPLQSLQRQRNRICQASRSAACGLLPGLRQRTHGQAPCPAAGAGPARLWQWMHGRACRWPSH